MRKFLAVAVLGASLAFTASAAFASENVDSQAAFQPSQSVAIGDRTESVESVIAGGVAPGSVWSEWRYDNFGQ